MKTNKYLPYVAILGIAAVFYYLYDKNIKKNKEIVEEKTIVDGEKKYTLAEWKKANEVSAALKGIKLA